MDENILEYKMEKSENDMRSINFRVKRHIESIEDSRAIAILKRLEDSKENFGDFVELTEDVIKDFGQLVNDENFMKAAVTIIPNCIENASDELKENSEVIKEAIETDFSVIDKIDKAVLINNPELLSLAVNKFNSEIIDSEIIKIMETKGCKQQNISMEEYDRVSDEVNKYSDTEKLKAMLEMNNSKYFEDKEILKVFENYEKEQLESKAKRIEDKQKLTLSNKKIERINSGEYLELPMLVLHRKDKEESLSELAKQKAELVVKEKQAKELLKQYEGQQKSSKNDVGE